ncbi:MAG: dihydroorotate dehydrogenase electron transfer subunit [Mycoplasmataceae bacterium]|nr:dihydroorotate dehydrogenase electron transfer subunit [Mycoplasmataceae bacterium]
MILKNEKLNEFVYRMTVSCLDTGWIKPGKFINVKIPGFYLRRPMAVCDYTNDSFSFIYEIIGNGTDKLSTMKPNQEIDILEDLGNTFHYRKDHGKPLLISGGSGIGPIYCLAKQLNKDNIQYDWICGFPNQSKVALVSEIKKINPNAIICTDDGSFGEKGNVVQIINKHNLKNHYYFTCGSTNMLKAIFKNNKQGQLSLDERMGCGFGACMGCSIKTRKGEQRICKNGPIFKSEDLLW